MGRAAARITTASLLALGIAAGAAAQDLPIDQDLVAPPRELTDREILALPRAGPEHPPLAPRGAAPHRHRARAVRPAVIARAAPSPRAPGNGRSRPEPV